MQLIDQKFKRKSIKMYVKYFVNLLLRKRVFVHIFPMLTSLIRTTILWLALMQSFKQTFQFGETCVRRILFYMRKEIYSQSTYQTPFQGVLNNTYTTRKIYYNRLTSIYEKIKYKKFTNTTNFFNLTSFLIPIQ